MGEKALRSELHHSRKWLISLLMWLPFLFPAIGVGMSFLQFEFWSRSPELFILLLFGMVASWMTMSLPRRLIVTLGQRERYLTASISFISALIAGFVTYHIVMTTTVTVVNSWRGGILWIVLLSLMILLALSIATNLIYIVVQQSGGLETQRIAKWIVYGSVSGGIANACYMGLFLIAGWARSPTEFLRWASIIVTCLTVVLLPTIVSIRGKRSFDTEARFLRRVGFPLMLLSAYAVLVWAYLLSGWDILLIIAHEALKQ